MRSIKNRFAGIEEIGFFEMTASGLMEVSGYRILTLIRKDVILLACSKS